MASRPRGGDIDGMRLVGRAQELAALERFAREAAALFGHAEPLSALAHALGETAWLDGDTVRAADQFEHAVALLQDMQLPRERVESQLRAAAACLPKIGSLRRQDGASHRCGRGPPPLVWNHARVRPPGAAQEEGVMKRKHKVLAAILATMFVATAAALTARVSETAAATTETVVATTPSAPPVRVATLQHDPQFILEAVATRMGVRLRPDRPPPTIRFESRTPLVRLQAAVERQWGFRPEVFTTTYATATNEIYVIDEAGFYEQSGGTLDDSVAHELVHYIQAQYRGDRFTLEWSEAEAVAVQTWFRETYMASWLAATKAPRSSPAH